MRALAFVTWAIAALLGTGVEAGQRDRQMGGVGITVYADREFRGRNATFRDAVENLEGYDLNDRISSLEVAPGETWEVCEHANFQGRCQVFSGAEPNLSDRRWNDTISSMRRVRGGGGGWPGGGGGYGGIALFDREDYEGQQRVFTREVSNLQLEGFNDRARSLRLPRSQTWEVCVDANYRNCRVVNSDWPELDRLGMDRKISSLRPWRQGGGVGGFPPPGAGYGRLILFEDPFFRGRSYTLQGADANIGGGQRVESVQISGGSWQLCDRPRYGGRCVTVTDNLPDLSATGLRGRVRSARPLATPYR
jgi:hypothetical protein